MIDIKIKHLHYFYIFIFVAIVFMENLLKSNPEHVKVDIWSQFTIQISKI